MGRVINRRRAMGSKKLPIHFADPEAKRVLVGLWGGKDGGSASVASRVGKRKVPGIEGELTYEQAASVISFDAVFKNNTALTSFNEMRFFTSLSSLSNSCFTGCSSLRSIAIPPQPLRIFHNCFQGCSSLTAVHITDWEAWLSNAYNNLADNPVYYSHALYLNGEEVAGEVTIPEGMTALKNIALAGMTNVTSVNIPDSVTSIGASAFYKTGLTSVYIPDSVTTIGNEAFGGCASLVEAHLPSGLTVLNAELFSSCGNLEHVNVPDSVVTIAGGVFGGCYRFKVVELGAGVESIGVNCFYRVVISTLILHSVTPPSLTSLGVGSGAAAIYVPDESVEAYKTATGWSSYADKIHPMSDLPVYEPLTRREYILNESIGVIKTAIVPQIGDVMEVGFMMGTKYSGALFSAGTGDSQLIFLSTGRQSFYTKYFHSGGAESIVIYPPSDTWIDLTVGSDGTFTATTEEGRQYSIISSPKQPLDGEDTTLWLLGRRNGTSPFLGKMKYFRLKRNGETLIDLVPYVNNEGVVGMLDEVTGTFYYAPHYRFEAGPVIE
jgi:hypothetical protein